MARDWRKATLAAKKAALAARATRRKNRTKEQRQAASKRAKELRQRKAAIARNTPMGFDQRKISKKLGPRQVKNGKHAVLVQLPERAGQLSERINKICSDPRNSLVGADGLEWAHGECALGGTPVPTVAMWLPPGDAAALAGSTHRIGQPWVRRVAKLLVELGEALEGWATEGSAPAMLVHPTKDFLRAAATGPELEHAHFNLETTEQFVHVDQAPGCATHINFVVPSVGRPWAQAHKIHERHLIKFCRRNEAGIPGALARAGVVSFDAAPGGRTAIAFPSATPHYGVGREGKKTPMVFFAGTGAVTHLEAAGAPSANFFGGRGAGGAPQPHCAKDAVVPIPGVLKLMGESKRKAGAWRDQPKAALRLV